MTNATVNQPTNQPADDPLDAAMNPTPASLERNFWGEVVTVDAWHCRLVKGQGKVVWDPSADSIDQRRTAIKIGVEITPKDSGRYTVEREVLDTSPEWIKHTLPSLRKLELDLRTLKGRWVQIKSRPTGQTYTNSAGEVKERSAIVFIEVYPDRETAQAAADAFFSRGQASKEPATDQQPQAAQPSPSADAQTVATQPATDNAERLFAKQALPLLWQASGEQRETFLDMIKANPQVAKYFNETSDEVVELIQDIAF